MTLRFRRGKTHTFEHMKMRLRFRRGEEKSLEHMKMRDLCSEEVKRTLLNT